MANAVQSLLSFDSHVHVKIWQVVLVVLCAPVLIHFGLPFQNMMEFSSQPRQLQLSDDRILHELADLKAQFTKTEVKTIQSLRSRDKEFDAMSHHLDNLVRLQSEASCMDKLAGVKFDSPPDGQMAKHNFAMFSEWHQDWVVHSLFGRKSRGPGFIYLDLATNDPVRFSNTYFADSCLDWSGICIEANPNYYSAIDKWRSCKVVKTCVTERVMNITFAKEGTTGHIGQAGSVDSVSLECTTLRHVLTDHGINHVHYMSLDIEGAELAALKGVDWAHTTFDVITVENAGAELRQFLLNQGMEPVLCVSLDTLFIRSANTELVKRARDFYSRGFSNVLPSCITDQTDQCLGQSSPSFFKCSTSRR